VTKKELVLEKLQRRPIRGVTALDFPTGFRVAARIHDLRRKGYDILTIESGVGKLARYRLVDALTPSRRQSDARVTP
jgi:hypothetical protein